MSRVPENLVIRGGRVVTPEACTVADIAIAGGAITEIGVDLNSAAREIDATGCWVLPGFIDAHTHFNEPGRTEWEGFAHGTRALLAGGGTGFIDMPLNCSPPILEARSLRNKIEALRQRSLLSGALWGGIVPGNRRELSELAAGGVTGFKAFMCASGLDDFPAIHGPALREAMAVAAELGLPVGLHAESERMTRALAAEAQTKGATGQPAYLAARPIAAELEAIEEAIGYAQSTGCRLHFVHISSWAGLDRIAQGRAAGLDLTAETCPHYLLYSEEAVIERGAIAKCSPPLRPAAEVENLWQALVAGMVETIGSDHSPAPPELKQAESFFAVWGGIAGVQHAFPAFFQAAVLERQLDPVQVARLCSTHVARRFGLPGIGAIAPGFVADLVILHEAPARPILESELLYRHPTSLYVGRSQSIQVRQTLVAGQVVYDRGRFRPHPAPRFLTPTL